MVLRHEAEELGIEADDDRDRQRGESARALSRAKTDSTSPRYTQFADNALAPMGFSEAQIEELVADQIALEKLKKILERRGECARVRNEARL